MTSTAIALVLEDEPLIAMDIELILEDAGFAVSTVMSCEEATNWLATNRPDIVVVDIMLHDGASDAVAARLVAESIPFIVYSGDLRDQHVGTPFEHGVWLSKPALSSELADTARALLAV